MAAKQLRIQPTGPEMTDDVHFPSFEQDAAIPLLTNNSFLVLLRIRSLLTAFYTPLTLLRASPYLDQ